MAMVPPLIDVGVEVTRLTLIWVAACEMKFEPPPCRQNVLHSHSHSAYSRRPMGSQTFNVAALAGDGIGPEVMREAIKVLRAVETKFSLRFRRLAGARSDRSKTGAPRARRVDAAAQGIRAFRELATGDFVE